MRKEFGVEYRNRKSQLKKCTEYIKADGNTDLKFMRTGRITGIDLGGETPLGGLKLCA